VANVLIEVPISINLFASEILGKSLTVKSKIPSILKYSFAKF